VSNASKTATAGSQTTQQPSAEWKKVHYQLYQAERFFTYHPKMLESCITLLAHHQQQISKQSCK
jgi:hypothetical protein